MTIKTLFKSAKKWTKGTFARTKVGNPCSVDVSYAESFCLVGAIMKCHEFNHQSIMTKIARKLKISADPYSLAKRNDDPSRTFKEIKKLVKDLNI